MSKLLRISNSKYRAVISEVLPYERPVFFTNRFFARFLKYYGVKVEKDVLVATRNADEPGLTEFLTLLGGKANDKRPCFQYSITKDGRKEGRCLSVIHPFHQVKMLEFYDRYKMLLIDFCQRSNFSIRYPYKVADYQKKSKGYYKIMSDDAFPVDTSESLKHFFSYKHYKNINNFYDDYRFLRAEKKFAKMVKMDLEKCFESISPDKLSFAMFGHEMEDCKGSMAYDFCQLQQDFQNLNNGIIIGPEFSRIYAEIVLQRIDVDVEKILNEKGLSLKEDYLFYRYVDDGFLFFNTEQTKEQFIYTYWNVLAKYGLRINKKKVLEFSDRPFVQNIGVVKNQLLHLIDVKFENRLQTFKGFAKMQNKWMDTPTKIDSKTFIGEVRNILRLNGSCDGKYAIKYKDITSYLLGIIQKRLIKLLADFNILYGQYKKAEYEGYINKEGLQIKERYEREFLDFCINIVEILFYFLECDLRMSTSVKTVSIINKLQLFLRGKYQIKEYTKSNKFPITYVQRLDAKISDEIANVFQNVSPKASNLMEVLNLLEVEKVMSIQYQIKPKMLNDFLKKCELLTQDLNFFIVFEILHFTKNANRYQNLEPILNGWIDKQINSLHNTNVSSTEAVLTFLEVMCCPWFTSYKKHEYANLLFGKSSEKIYQFAKKKKELFIKWEGYQLDEAIQQINSEEVY